MTPRDPSERAAMLEAAAKKLRYTAALKTAIARSEIAHAADKPRRALIHFLRTNEHSTKPINVALGSAIEALEAFILEQP